MIANARMYSVTPPVAALWRRLLGAILADADGTIDIVDHASPAPISELWQRSGSEILAFLTRTTNVI